MGTEIVQVLVADDHRIILDLLEATLNKMNGFQVVGRARDGHEAVRIAGELRPDLVLIDIDMPGISGIEATRRILSALPEVRVIALSVHEDWETISSMFQAGAMGYVPKDSGYQELLDAIRAVMSGQVFISPAVGSVVITGRTGGSSEPSALDALTDREREVFQFLADGLSTKEIAFKLNLSIHTAHTHRRNILRKLDLGSIAQLIRFSLQLGPARPDGS